ncbi:MAG: hypothetical protein ABSC25_25700 [Roseiarcus sp.]
MSLIELQTDAEKALTLAVHEGVLKGGGRVVVGSVATEVYRRIDDYGRKASREASPGPEASSCRPQMHHSNSGGRSWMRLDCPSLWRSPFTPR